MEIQNPHPFFKDFAAQPYCTESPLVTSVRLWISNTLCKYAPSLKLRYIAPENGPSQKERIVFQTYIVRGMLDISSSNLTILTYAKAQNSSQKSGDILHQPFTYSSECSKCLIRKTPADTLISSLQSFSRRWLPLSYQTIFRPFYPPWN